MGTTYIRNWREARIVADLLRLYGVKTSAAAILRQDRFLANIADREFGIDLGRRAKFIREAKAAIMEVRSSI